MISAVAEVLWIARYDYKPGWKLKKHKHPFYQIIFILDGYGEFFLDNSLHEIKHNDMFIIRPEQFHGLETNKNGVLKTLDIKFIISDNELKSYVDKLPDVMQVNDQQIKLLFEKIRQEGIDKGCFYKEFSCQYLSLLLLTLIRNNGLGYGEDRQMFLPDNAREADLPAAIALDHIKNHYSEDLTLRGIANSLNYNKNYICEIFKKSFGMTPMKYLYRYRIEKAKELIKYSDFSLKEIAKITGFKSIYHFYKLFCACEKLPPGKWREMEREGIRKDIYLNDNYQNIIMIDGIDS